MATPCRLYSDYADDFEARVRILRADEGSRQTPPWNGIRWNFCYAPDQPLLHYLLLAPDFFDPATGHAWRNQPLPVDEWLPVRVSVLSEHTRPVHQATRRLGTSFYYCAREAR